MAARLQYLLLILLCLNAIPAFTAAGTDTWIPLSDSAVYRIEAPARPLPEGLSSQFDIQPLVKRPDKTPLFSLLIVLSIFFVVIFLNFRRDIRDMITALGNINLASQQFRNREFALSPFNFVFFVFFVFSMGLYLLLLAPHLGIRLESRAKLPELFNLYLLIGLVFIVRDASRRLTAAIFSFAEDLLFFNFHISLLNNMAGLSLLPICFMMAFGPAWLAEATVYLSLAWLGFLFLMRNYKGILIAVRGGTSVINKHFLLYICTLEIAPVLILIKLITAWLS